MDNFQSADINVIFSIREEFFGQFQREFEKVIRAFLNECERVNIEPLSLAEAREAIINPLKNLTVKIGYDNSFVDKVLLTGLLEQTSDQVGIEPPHLQIVCNQLFETAQKRLSAEVDMVQINAALYAELGGVEKILQTYLDDVVKEITADQPVKIVVIRSLLKAMIETAGTRRFVSVADLQRALPDVDGATIEPFLRQLQDRRVLETWLREGESQFSLSHEIMVAQVASWFDEREWERKRAEETLERGLKEWANSKTLLNEKQFSHIRQWLPQVDEVDENAQALLVKSETAVAEQKRKEKWQSRLKQALVSLVFIAAIVAVWFAYRANENEKVALVNEEKAKHQAKVAQDRQLSAQTMLATKLPNAVNGYFDRALLLAAQLFKGQESNLDSRGTLLRVLNSFDMTLPKISGHLFGSHSSVAIIPRIAFSPDGQTLANGGWENTVILWDMKTRQPLGKTLPRSHSNSVTSIAFSPDGQILASGSLDNTIILWDVKTLQPIGEPLRGHSKFVTSVVFSPDGQILASGSLDRVIILWDVKTQQITGGLQQHRFPVHSIAFSPDGQTLASGGGVRDTGNSEVILWDIKTRQPLNETLQGHGSLVTSVDFSPDGQTLAIGVDNTVMLLDIVTRQLLGESLQGHRSLVESVSFNSNGQILASGSDDGVVILWDMKTRQPLGEPLQGHGGFGQRVAFSPNNQTLAGCSKNGGTATLWDLRTRQLLGEPLQGHYSAIRSVTFSADGKMLASGSEDKTIILWDTVTHQPLGSPLQGHREKVRSLAFSPDSKMLASSGFDNTVILWDVKTRQPLGEPLQQSYRSIVYSVAISPDGQTLAGGSSDKTIILWDVRTHQLLGKPLQGHSDMVFSLTFSPDGKVLASGSQDNTIILWDVKTRQMLGKPLQGHNHTVSSVVFSPDSQTLASGGAADGLVILWDVKTHQMLGKPLQAYNHWVTSIAFSSDGKTLASGSADKTVLLWDVKMGKPIGERLQGHRGDVYSVAFSPDGKTLASGSEDKTIILWDVDPQSWYEKACRIVGRNLTYEEWQRYLPDEPYQKTCPQYPEGGGWEQVLFKDK